MINTARGSTHSTSKSCARECANNGKISSRHEILTLTKLLNEKQQLLSSLSKTETETETTEENKIIINDLKTQLKTISKQITEMQKLKLNSSPTTFFRILLERCFVIPSFEIYGGVSGLKDLGPLGCSLKNNLIKMWRQHFVLEDERMLEIESSSLICDEFYKRFSDRVSNTIYLVRDLVSGEEINVTRLIEDQIQALFNNNMEHLTSAQILDYQTILNNIDSYDSNQLDQIISRLRVKSRSDNKISQVFEYSNLFKTHIGGGQSGGGRSVFLRPDLDQGILTNFKRLWEFGGKKLPFAVAQVGSIYSNHPPPASSSCYMQLRESTSAKILHFMSGGNKKEAAQLASIDDSLQSVVVVLLGGDEESKEVSMREALELDMVANTSLAYYMARVQQFVENECGFISPDGVRFRKVLFGPLCVEEAWDCEVLTTNGWITIVNIQSKMCVDLMLLHSQQQQSNTMDLLTVFDSLDDECEETVEHNVTPHVVELTFSMSTIMMSLLEHVFWIRPSSSSPENDDSSKSSSRERQKIVLSIPFRLAPIKVLIVSSNKMDQSNKHSNMKTKVIQIVSKLSLSYKVDESGASIGKKYCKGDEMGIPITITIDEEGISNESVTLRHRDDLSETPQERIEITLLQQVLSKYLIDNQR